MATSAIGGTGQYADAPRKSAGTPPAALDQDAPLLSAGRPLHQRRARRAGHPLLLAGIHVSVWMRSRLYV